MSDSEVTVTVPEPDEPSNDAPDVVVVDTGDNDSGVTDHVIDHAERLAALEAENAELRRLAEQAAATAEVAQAVAEIAAEDAAEPEPVIVESEPEPEPEPDVEPDRTHPFHRPLF